MDLHFKSYFIANSHAIADGKLRKLDSLEELAPMLEGLSFTFGSKQSTSGHIMPRYFMALAGIDPERDIEGGPKYQLRGGHDATLRAVASGLVDFGALNYTTWEAATPNDKANAPIIYVTPDYVDYCLVAHNRLGADTIDKIRAALTKLDRQVPEHRQILDAFSAEKFVAANAGDWDGIRNVLKDPRLQEILK
jgi:phosphonate transport system substrate-binding protein